MQLSKPKLSKFWRLFADAASENLPSNATTKDKDAYRHRLIQEVTGQPSLKNVTTCEFERLMQRLAAETENYDARVYWQTCQERKYVYLIGIMLSQISSITRDSHTWSYIKGVLRQAHWPEDWRDISADMDRSVFQMLDTHRRRLLRQAGWRGAIHGEPLNFCASRTYYLAANNRLVYRDDLPVDAINDAERVIKT